MENIIDYLKQFKPSCNRDETTYYAEMQQLAYNLVRYLSMNDTPNEYKYQGNYNMTYLKENMTDADFEFVCCQFLKCIPLGRIRDMIREHFGEDLQTVLYPDIKEFIDDIKSVISEMENSINTGDK